jgi:hypothetical protein
MRIHGRNTVVAQIASRLIISIALCLAIGCSKSSTTQASFGSSSDSSSSPFKSSSKSSGNDEKKEKDGDKGAQETAYQRDVRNHTAEFARSAGEPDIEIFQRDLGGIAEGYGITDWEHTEDTYVAVGRGLADSELDDTSAKQLAVALSNQDYDHLMLIRSGYADRRTQ